ncbi:hypothetical protein BDN72DRAFT_849442 [Pluteus cervinus]|uniref:Uncharacterized protein n=1 Tax=Pluteus cervinus TaxID=181527 RepID=A0ACD3A800_9AGAR|nr:hypothetical protein BDN72DRAFT_849442 [Pluteus cervinus]
MGHNRPPTDLDQDPHSWDLPFYYYGYATSLFFLITLYQHISYFHFIRYRFPKCRFPRFFQVVLAATTSRALYYQLVVINGGLNFGLSGAGGGGGGEVDEDVRVVFLKGLLKGSDVLVFGALFVLLECYEGSPPSLQLVDPQPSLEESDLDLDVEASELAGATSTSGSNNANPNRGSFMVQKVVNRVLIFASMVGAGVWAGFATYRSFEAAQWSGEKKEFLNSVVFWLDQSHNMVFLPAMTVDLLISVFKRKYQWDWLGAVENSQIRNIAYKLGPVLLSLGLYRNGYAWYMNHQDYEVPVYQIVGDLSIRGIHDVLLLKFLTQIGREVLKSVVEEIPLVATPRTASSPDEEEVAPLVDGEALVDAEDV